MKASCRLFLLIIASLIHQEEACAQRSFQMVTQTFDLESQSWRDTVSITEYWLNHTGELDSVVESVHGSWRLNKFYDWVPVSEHVRPSTMHGLFSGFSQLQTANQLPKLTHRYSRNIDGAQLEEIDSAVVVGDRLQKYQITQFSNTGVNDRLIKDSYEYTANGEMREFQQFERTIWGEEALLQVFRKDRYYDDNGLVSSSTTSSKSFGLEHPFDSIAYQYDSEGRLNGSMYFHLENGLARPSSKLEYRDWVFYSSESTPFLSSSIAVGNESYRQRTDYDWDASLQDYTMVSHSKREFDAEGRLTRSTVTDTLGNASRYVTLYYPNGDLLEDRLVVNLSNDSGKAKRFYDNQYRTDGLLSSSTSFAWGEPVRRYTFIYPSARVKTLQQLNQETTFGREITLESGQQLVCVHDILGKKVYREDCDDSSVSLTHLPSGLYFISIDGGKPRKHLIP